MVGIDQYKDRMPLHNGANDAQSIADLMQSLGYRVILLSDRGEKTLTKHNILDVALRDKQQKG